LDHFFGTGYLISVEAFLRKADIVSPVVECHVAYDLLVTQVQLVLILNRTASTAS